MTPAEVVAPLPGLRGFAVRLAGQDADDVMQVAAESAIRNCGRISTAADAKAWLYTSMRNRVRNNWRDYGRRIAPLEDAPEPTTDAAGDSTTLCREVLIVIGRMFPEDQRALMAAMLGDAADPKILARARHRLRLALGEGV